jgi:hypothetical protein
MGDLRDSTARVKDDVSVYASLSESCRAAKLLPSLIAVARPGAIDRGVPMIAVETPLRSTQLALRSATRGMRRRNGISLNRETGAATRARAIRAAWRDDMYGLMTQTVRIHAQNHERSSMRNPVSSV